MYRRQLLESVLATASLSASSRHATSASPRPTSTGHGVDPEARDVFPYRGWGFCVYAYDWELLERYVYAALDRAQDYNINTFELHDFNLGRLGLVDSSVVYRYFPRLHAREMLTYGNETVSRAKKARDYQRLRDLCKRIKSKNLKVNLCYRVLRDKPSELLQDYPEIQDLDGGFYWRYIEGLLKEFFERIPEVDRLTVTTLKNVWYPVLGSGQQARKDFLLKLHNVLYDACRRAGKELIVRDLLVEAEIAESFLGIVGQMPTGIYIMTKEVLGDWTHFDMAPNPYLRRYAGRKLIVEFDLYGEYWGSLDIPACYPEYIHRQIRTIKAFQPAGAMGRVIHDNASADAFRTIFESPSDINCYAFGKYLSKPLPWLARGAVTDPREKLGRWGWDLDAFDKKVWMEWVTKRYGRQAAIPMIRALSRTDAIASLLLNIGGRGFQAHSRVPGNGSVAFLWEPFVDQVESLGMEFLRDEKIQAYRMTEQCLAEILSGRDALSRKDFEELVTLFEGEELIIRGYQAVLEAYFQVYLAEKQSNRSGLRTTSEALSALASEIARVRGEKFFRGLPDTLRGLTQFVEAGKAPASIKGS